MLVFNPWDFGAEERADPSAIILFHRSDREICRILEHEQEHDYSTAAFRFARQRDELSPLELPARILERQNVLQTNQVLFRRMCLSLGMVLPFKDSAGGT